MSCQECREELAAYLEGLLDETCRNRIEAHLAECSDCRVEHTAVQELMVHLTRDGLDMSPVSLEATVMDRILHQQALELRRLKMRKRLRVMGMSGALAAAAALFLVSGIWLTQPAAAEKAAEVLARCAQAAPSASTVHIVAKIRTSPHDNFAFISPHSEFYPIEVWKQWGEKPKWRVQKPERVAVMDGTTTKMLIGENSPVAIPHATDAPFDTGWIMGLTKVQDLLTRELRTALAKGWDLKASTEATPQGQKRLVVTVEAKADPKDAQGALARFSELKNNFFDLADMRRVYRFDAATQKLEGMEATLHEPSGDVLIFAITKIEYDQPIDPALFSLKLPDNVEWIGGPPAVTDNKRYESLTPQQAARIFFEACAKRDWPEAAKFWVGPISEQARQMLGGLQLVRLGEPFQWKTGFRWFRADPRWLVPFEIKLADGTVRKQNLRMRNDNSSKRYAVEEGYWLTQPAAAQEAEEVMRRLAETAPRASSYHVVAKLRTAPADSFSMISAGEKLVPVEIWSQLGIPDKWRVEKPGRVIVMDGRSTVMLIRPESIAIKLPFVTHGALDSGVLLELADVSTQTSRELNQAQPQRWDLAIRHETTPEGRKEFVITVDAKAGVADGDRNKNTYWHESDMRRMYRFDENTQQLRAIEAYLRLPGGDVLILSTERIEYNKPIDAAVFALKLPDDVQWYEEPQPLPDNEKYAKLTPKEAAQALLEACAREDWNEAKKFCPLVTRQNRKDLGGLKIVHLGEPYEPRKNNGWHVPYEVKLKDGRELKGELGMRNSNPGRRYVAEGGLPPD